jgi:lipopolysaccharide transport system ATP-binding protein
MSTVIRVENLSKKYIIQHQGQASGNGLRHVIQDAVAAPFRKLAAIGKKQAPAAGGQELSHTHAAGGGGPEEFWALKDVSFEVQQGDVVGIIGRNGAGKSTLLKVLSRITEPTSGKVHLKGRVASLLEVGTGFHPELTGRENIFLNGAILGMSQAEIRKKFDEIVAFAEVEKFLDTPVKRYSSGMYVRLAFAVAAHLEPEILVVDEVLAVGDAEFQKKCLGKMKEVAGYGRTILFVSHNITAVAAICQSGIYMKNGFVDRAGSIDSVIKHYMHESSVGENSTVEKLRLPEMGEELAFTSIEMAQKQPNVFYGSPLVFELKIQSKKDFDDLSVASSIMNRSGLCVGTLFSPVRFNIKAGEKKHIRLSIKNHKLAPDRYHAGFSVGKGGVDTQRRDLDVILGRPYFEILPHSKNHTYINWQSTNWGQIHFEDNEVEVISSSL